MVEDVAGRRRAHQRCRNAEGRQGGPGEKQECWLPVPCRTSGDELCTAVPPAGLAAALPSGCWCRHSLISLFLFPSPICRAHHAPAQQHGEQHDAVVDSPGETQRHHSRLRDQVLREGKAKQPLPRPGPSGWPPAPQRRGSLQSVWGRGAATGGPQHSGDTPVSPLQQGQSDGIANTVTSQKNSVRLDGLKANARYMVQVRARTVAGYGRYSLPTEFQTTAEDGRYQDRAASVPQFPKHAPPQSLTLISASPSTRLHREDFPGAASDRGLGHCGAALRHRCGRHRYRLLQVLPSQGAGLQSRVWGLLTPAGRAPAAPV